MSDTVLVNPKEYDVDLHDVYASFMGHFERKSIPYYTHSYGTSYFLSFSDFLSFGWGAIVVTDKRTGKGHVAVRAEGAGPSMGGGAAGGGGAGAGAGGAGVGGSGGAGGIGGLVGGTVQQFARMIRVRFGENLPRLPTQLPLSPYESKPRLLRYINDYASYKRLAATVPAAELNTKKKKVRHGDAGVVGELWGGRGHSFLALEITWWDKAPGVILEAGLCGCRCRNIDAMDSWPPVPDENYRRSHYVVSDWLDKRTNSHHHMPSQPRSYAHGESQLVSMGTLEKIINASISSLASVDHDSGPNTLVILTIGDTGRFTELKNVNIPSNVLIVDVSALERSLYSASISASSTPANGSPSGGSYVGDAHEGRTRTARSDALGRGHHPPELPRSRSQGQPLSLRGICNQLNVPMPAHIPLSNAGNYAFYLMLVFQLLVDRDATIPPVLLQHPPGPQMRYAMAPYPSFQIYPASGPVMPIFTTAPQPSYSPRKASTRHDFPSTSWPGSQARPNPPSAMKRATTMYWDAGLMPSMQSQETFSPQHTGNGGVEAAMSKLTMVRSRDMERIARNSAAEPSGQPHRYSSTPPPGQRSLHGASSGSGSWSRRQSGLGDLARRDSDDL